MLKVKEEYDIQVGDRVNICQQDERIGSVEAIRLIAEGRLVEHYVGSPDEVVITVQVGDTIFNQVGADVYPIQQLY